MDMGEAHVLGVDHGGIVVAVHNDQGVVDDDLLHLPDQVCPLFSVHLTP